MPADRFGLPRRSCPALWLGEPWRKGSQHFPRTWGSPLGWRGCLGCETSAKSFNYTLIFARSTIAKTGPVTCGSAALRRNAAAMVPFSCWLSLRSVWENLSRFGRKVLDERINPADNQRRVVEEHAPQLHEWPLLCSGLADFPSGLQRGFFVAMERNNRFRKLGPRVLSITN